MTGQILSDNHFLTKFSSKSQTDKDITSVQTCLKYKSGLGKPYFVKFYANINWREPNDRILYDLKAFEEEHELIEYDEQTYCMVQCTKIGYFISKMYNIEILRMQCEFLKDENSTIWFTYATKIAYRFIVEQVPE